LKNWFAFIYYLPYGVSAATVIVPGINNTPVPMTHIMAKKKINAFRIFCTSFSFSLTNAFFKKSPLLGHWICFLAEIRLYKKKQSRLNVVG